MDLANRLFVRHLRTLDHTTRNSGSSRCSWLSCIFLGTCLDVPHGPCDGWSYRLPNPMAIHRFNTFLGMTTLSNRSEVSYLSRGGGRKDGSIEREKRSRHNFAKPEPNGWPQTYMYTGLGGTDAHEREPLSIARSCSTRS